MRLHKKQLQTHSLLDSDRVGPLLLKLAGPAFMGMFVQSFYNLINTIFMGQYVNDLAIAGLSIVFPIQMIMYGISQLVGMGGASLISRCIGSREEAKAERTLGNGITVGIILAVIYTIMIMPFSTFWLKLIGTTPEVMPYAQPYLLIVISCSVVNVFAMALQSYVRAEGNMRVGMFAMMAGAILSILLDILFVPILKMGVVGAGLATVISQVVALAYLLSYYISGSSYLKIRWQNLKPDFSIIRPILSIGIASFLQITAGSLSSVLLINMVLKYGGDPSLEAYGIIQRVSMFAGMPAMVFGQALQPVLGYNYGAKHYARGLKSIQFSAFVATAMVIVTAGILYLFPGPIASIFTKDQTLVDLTVHSSRLYFISIPFMGVMMVGQTIFQALGKAIPAFITAFVRPIVFLIPLVFLFSNSWKLDGVFLSFPASDTLTLFMVIGLVIPVIHQLRKLSATETHDDKTVNQVPAAAPTGNVR
jgi:putative MATE family efflux protein